MQPQYPPGYQTFADRQPSRQGEDARQAEGADAMDCPECGRRLADMAQRRKEAMLHYGADNIPRYPNHDTAANRKGALLNVDPASLRG